jgi:excisionase family DNA binding protein
MPRKSITAAVEPHRPAAMLSRLLTPVEAAAVVGVGKTKLLELVRARRLPCVMLDNRIRIREDALAAFIAALPNGYEKQRIPDGLRNPAAAN